MNGIPIIMHGDVELTEEVSIDQAFVEYYMGIFGKCLGHRV